MFLVKFEKKCACLKKSDYAQEKIFESEQKALEYAKELLSTLNTKLCQKHIFSYKKNNNIILIEMDIRE